jgi:hypothetical protein
MTINAKNKEVIVKRNGNRIISIKTVLGKYSHDSDSDSACVPQTIKRNVFEKCGALIQRIR